MKSFTQLSLDERKKLYMAHRFGCSIRNIASHLGRSPSTISRELQRNKESDELGYLPDMAQVMAMERKHKHKPKLEQCPELKNHIIEKLFEGWSPEVIAGRLKLLGASPCRVCVETIYQFVYSSKGIELGLPKLLAKGRPRRGIKYGRKPRGVPPIPDRVSIHDRPEHIKNRSELGHFEGDLTFFKNNQSGNIVVMLERKSRLAILKKNDSKRTDDVMKSIFNALAQLPQQARKTITFDNGKEFTKHGVLKRHLNMDTFFCDKHSPWQKGQVENYNALLHRFITKNTPLENITDELLQAVQDKINERPRKCLGFKTPTEVFQESLCQSVAFRA